MRVDAIVCIKFRNIPLLNNQPLCMHFSFVVSAIFGNEKEITRRHELFGHQEVHVALFFVYAL